MIVLVLAGLGASASAASAAPPTLTKDFAATSIKVGGETNLTFTIDDPNAFDISGVGFTDTLPSGLVVETAGLVSDTCFSNTGAQQDSALITVNDGFVGAHLSSQIVVAVKGTASGAAAPTTTQTRTRPATTLIRQIPDPDRDFIAAEVIHSPR